MAVIKQIINYFRREKDKSVDAGTVTPMTPREGAMSVWGYVPTPMSVATVYRCVKLLSESVANLPLQFMKLKGDIFTEERGGLWWYLLNVQPDAAISAFDFWRCAVQNVLLDGNAYIVPVYDTVGMEVSRLVLCGRGTVSHDTLNDIYTVNDIENSICGTYDESEIIHLKGLTGINYKTGVSVLTYARLTTGIAATGDRETQSRFENGGNVRGIVSNDRGLKGFGEYQDKELAKTAENIDSRFQCGERIVSLPGQVDFQQISLTSTDMEFLGTRKFTVLEICRFFGVHPYFVFADTSTNYKSVEQANVAFLSHTLAPLLRCIETELLRKLVDPSTASRCRFQFDRRGLHACDLEGQTKYRGNLLQMGTTVNEIRRMDNLPPVDGGDTVLVSANLRNINEPTATQPTDNPDKETANKDNDDDENKE